MNVIPQGILPAAATESSMQIDILGRQELVEQIINLLKMLSDAKSSCTFALNGKWGSGKTFILNMLEKQLQDYQAGEKFMVFHYNCWQYDYYEEPLIAIVSAMLDSLDKNTSIFSNETKTKIQSISVNLAKRLKNTFNSVIKEKIGIDIGELIDFLIEVEKGINEKSESSHDYDAYYTFSKVIENAKNDFAELTKDQTLIIVVDELDRCLPGYAIKVLERLHHLFSDLDNTILVMALDKMQLENAIKQIFGGATKSGVYLKKFIDFELEVDVGSTNSSFFDKFSDYIALFDENALASWPDLHTFISALFSQIEIRHQEHLIKKIQMVHQLLFDLSFPKDYSFLCFELLMVVLSDCGIARDSCNGQAYL